ncbi:hypothetical protein O181_108438, partial [Austropuccinia psidii MF-1]|nr:hypothetical protein [Austropuccinia psidii MF-1]
MENGQQAVQPSITLGRTWSKLPEYVSQRDKVEQWCGTPFSVALDKAVLEGEIT